MRELNASPRLRGLNWVMAALAAAVGPQVPHLPAWVTLLLLAVCAWRWTADLRGWKLAPLPLRVVVVLVSLLVTLIVFIIIDLDRPKRGVIQVNQSPLLELQHNVRMR